MLQTARKCAVPVLRGSSLLCRMTRRLGFISFLYEFNNYLKTNKQDVGLHYNPVAPLCFLPPQTNFCPPPPPSVSAYTHTCQHFAQWRTEGGGLGGSAPPSPKFRRYRWSPRSHEQEEPASRFPFVVHCVLIRL